MVADEVNRGRKEQNTEKTNEKVAKGVKRKKEQETTAETRLPAPNYEQKMTRRANEYRRQAHVRLWNRRAHDRQ